MNRSGPASAVAFVAVCSVASVFGWARLPAATGTTADADANSTVAWEVGVLPPAIGDQPASIEEPGIAVGPNGMLIVNAARANEGYPTWWMSSDAGAHWGPGRNLAPSAAKTGDADAAFGPDGYVYILNLAFNDPPQQPVNPTILVYASSDGHDFDGPASFAPPHGSDQPDRPWLLADPYRPGRVLVTNSEGAGNVVAWTSSDHARTFSGSMLVTGVDHIGSIELTSRPLFHPVDRDRIVMLYEASTPDGLVRVPDGQPLRDFPLTQLWLAESTDAGSSWRNRLVLDITDAFGASAIGGSLGHVLPASAIDEEGTLYAAFSLRLGGETETHIFLIHSTDEGASWSNPVQVDSGDLHSNVMPAIAVGAPGRLDISWYGSRSPDFTDPASRWVEMFAQSLDALSMRPTFAMSQVGTLTHVGSVDASGNPGSNEYDWGLRDFQSIAIDASGMAHLAWTDTLRDATVVARQISGPSPRAPVPAVVMPGKVTKPPVSIPSRLPGTGVGFDPAGVLPVALATGLAVWARRRAR